MAVRNWEQFLVPFVNHFINLGHLTSTQGGGYGCLPVGINAKLIGCSCGVPCLHALEGHSRSNSCRGLGRTCC